MNPSLLIDVSSEAWRFPGKNKPVNAYVDRKHGWVVQVFDDCIGTKGTPWEGTLRVSVKHTNAKTPAEYDSGHFDVQITWDELQAIKDHFWPNRIALEIFPPHDKIVNVANMRWLWVLPEGAILPFNLQSTSKTILKS